MALDGNSIEVIDNFLSEEDFKQVTNIINNDMFPWYFNGAVADVQDTDNFYFTHIFYKDSKVESPTFNNALMPLLKKLPHKVDRFEGNSENWEDVLYNVNKFRKFISNNKKTQLV